VHKNFLTSNTLYYTPLYSLHNQSIKQKCNLSGKGREGKEKERGKGKGKEKGKEKRNIRKIINQKNL